MRHVVHYVWPIFRAVPPDWRKRVTFDAAGNKKATTFLQRRDVSTLTGIRPRQFSCDRRRCKTRGPATAKIDKANDCGGEDRELSHSETNSKNCPYLKIRLALCIGRLRESGNGYKPVLPAI